MNTPRCGCSLRVECPLARRERLNAEVFDRQAVLGNLDAGPLAAHHWRRYAAHRAAVGLRTPSRQRFLVLGGPAGCLTCVAAGDPQLSDRYRRWHVLFHVRRPLTPELGRAARGAALRCFELVSERRQ
jgi:hypothetical protein